MPQRRSKRGRDVTPTQGAPSSAYSKRQRVSTQRFEAGINPITPPASTKRPVSRPVSRLPSQFPNDALFVRENTHVGGEDSDHVGQDDEADPNPEDAVDTEPLPDAEEDLANEAAEESEASSEAYEVIATIRLRATFSDIEMNTNQPTNQPMLRFGTGLMRLSSAKASTASASKSRHFLQSSGVGKVLTRAIGQSNASAVIIF
jgi:hypothetical protein